MQKIFFTLVTVACLGLAGCATAGRDFNEARVQELVVGQSTKKDAIALFGPPNSVHVTGEGEMLIWTHAKVAAFAISTTSKSLALTFDKDGVLSGHHSTNVQSGL